MAARFLSSIDRVPAAQWNALNALDIPFLRHEFLAALEATGCVGKAAGWIPTHLILEDASGRLEGAAALYLKSHSWGEFVFDWSWARAYTQAGLEYYPKLVAMTPFTPASAPRLLVAPGADAADVRRRLAEAIVAHAREHELSSAHALFIDAAERDVLKDAGFVLRKDCQFHWHNHGFGSFEDFIATFRADKRKKALRERRRVREGGVEYLTLRGGDMTDKQWDVVFSFSARTFAQHGNDHYLSAAFFKVVSKSLPDAFMVKLAMHGNVPIAAAIFFRSHEALYGRYWGAAANFDSLHFETCYYQGIEYCIEQGLQHFEPGTQGEHKVARGFEPTETWSAHWIADRRFRQAIANYLGEERNAIDQYAQSVREHVPFRRTGEG